MNDRRLLRRYLALVRHADEMRELALESHAAPAPAEAVAVLEDLVATIEPALQRMNSPADEAREISLAMAGWVH